MHNEGRYYAHPIDGQMSYTSGGTEQMVVSFEITHVEDPAAENGWAQIPEPFNRSVYLYMSDKAYEYSEKHLETIGFSGNFENPAFDCSGCTIECNHETYNGQEREKWQISRGDAKPLEGDRLDVFRRRWANDHPAPRKPVGVATPPSAPPVVDDEDVPFDTVGTDGTH